MLFACTSNLQPSLELVQQQHFLQFSARKSLVLPQVLFLTVMYWSLLLQELAKESAANSELSQQVATLREDLLQERKACETLKAEIAALRVTVSSPPAPTPAAAAGAGRTPVGRTTGGRSAKRKRTEAIPEDEEMEGEGVQRAGVIFLVTSWHHAREEGSLFALGGCGIDAL
jgi:cell division protein FtsB